MENVFTKSGSNSFVERINQLTPSTPHQWGTMSVDQMLAHLNVSYDMVFTNKYPKPSGIAKWMLKLFVKKKVVGPKPYPKNGRTAPQFVIKEEKSFQDEKQKLVDFIQKVQELGEIHFDGLVSHSFGPLTKNEWNNMFAKHLEHHLAQFGV